mmetsp:Transcript_28227/g.52993  ORF Transcript_28227/g.52993 Transcript_28227/m.52993 type:complete len:270 (-) Transcript_28227:6-815(-)
MALPALGAIDSHWELIRQVAAADVRVKRAGRPPARIPPELSVPVLAAVAISLREQAKEQTASAAAAALAAPAPLGPREEFETPPPRWRPMRACRDKAIQAGLPCVDPPVEDPAPSPEHLSPERAGTRPTSPSAMQEDEDEPMPVAEHRFLEFEAPPDPAAAGMAALRKILEEATSLSDWTTGSAQEQQTKERLVADVGRLMEQLEQGVLDAVLEDTGEALTRLRKRRQVAELQRDFGDPGNQDMTVRDFVEKCQQFEDELCAKYGVRSV